MNSTGARDKICLMAETNPNAAIEAAKGIADPWFRCQTLSCAARFINDRDRQNSVMDLAFAAANQTLEPNRIVTVSAWPLEVLCMHGNYERLATEIARLVHIIETEPHPVRRNDALLMVLQNITAGPAESFNVVLEAFRNACRAAHGGWKTDRNLRDAARLLANRADSQAALELVNMITKPRARRQALRMIAQGDY